MIDHSAGSAALDALLEGAGSSLLILADARLRVARAGRGAAALADRPAEELAGMSLIAAFGSAPLDAVAREALASGHPAVGEAAMGRLGSRSFSIEAVPLAGGGVVIALHETTSQRRAERVRRDFVANISHELRTPLASIKLLAETLSGGAVDDPQTAHDFIQQIEREVDHLTQLVDELLDLSMIESGEAPLTLEPVAANEIVRHLAERIGPVADRRGIAVTIETPAGAEEVRALADRNRLGQALLNLAHNAVKFSRPHGEVRIGWAPSERGIRFSIADDGIGIPSTHLERIFERFYKVDRSRARASEDDFDGGSAGLGLAIVRHIADAHRGHAGVESTEGRGSTFWIEIPSA